MDTIQYKIEFESSLRRVSVRKGDSFASLKATLSALLGVPANDLRVMYRDEDNDLIVVDSDAELQDLTTNQGPNKVTRLVVTRGLLPSSGGSAVPEPAASSSAPPPKPKLPFEDLARLLADVELLQSIQALALGRSEEVVHLVSSTAQAYVDGENPEVLLDTVAALKHALKPMVSGLVEEVDTKHPELKQAFVKGVEETAGQHEGFPFPGMPFFVRMAMGGPHGGGMGRFRGHGGRCCPSETDKECGPAGGRCGPGNNNNKAKDFHPHVFCDGCETQVECKRASLAAGHRLPHRGFIVGPRWKSTSVHDFDLCQTCYEGKRFEASAGPFEERPSRRAQADHAAPAVELATNNKKPAAEPKQPASPAAVANEDASWVKVHDDLMAKWAGQLQVLASLGFEKSESYVALLEEEKGDMEKVVNRIIRREAQ